MRAFNRRMWLSLLPFLAARKAPAQVQTTMRVTVAFAPQTDVFTVSQPAYQLTQIPSLRTIPQVFLNGLLLLPGTDYTLSQQSLTMLYPVGDAPTIQAHYWTEKPA
jgi:hypothetical protein